MEDMPMATSPGAKSELKETTETMKYIQSRFSFVRLLTVGVLVILSGCISVRHDAEPTTTVTTMETRASTVVPTTTTTVERTTY
jgi:hypothetical protein